jgi:plastocyanin
MKLTYSRLPFRSGLRWAAGVALMVTIAEAGLPAAAQPGVVQSSPIAATAANCAIQLSVANPNPGNQEIPRSLVMSGSALDSTATSGTGISQVQAFLGNRDTGGTFVGAADFAQLPGAPGSWSLTATLPPNINGGQEMFVYGMSSVSGQEAVVSIPIVVGEVPTSTSVPDVAQSFCPTFMPPAAPVIPTVAPTAAPGATVVPTAVPTAPPAAPIIPTAVPTPPPAAPANPPVAAPPPAAIQLGISSPAAPPLTFDTNTLVARAGEQVTLTYTNDEVGVPHNWHLFNGPDSSAATIVATQIITGPGTMDTATFTAPTQTGNYFFWCDVHPTIMTGNLVVGP